MTHLIKNNTVVETVTGQDETIEIPVENISEDDVFLNGSTPITGAEVLNEIT